VRIARMAVRDGVPAEADHPAQRRYLDAQQIYRDACRPLETADILVDNTDPARPRIARIPPRLAVVAQNGQS
jgi:uridine kinase